MSNIKASSVLFAMLFICLVLNACTDSSSGSPSESLAEPSDETLVEAQTEPLVEVQTESLVEAQTESSEGEGEIVSPYTPENPYIGYGKSVDGVRVLVKNDGGKSRLGYADEEGRVIVEPEYTSAVDFVNGVGVVKSGEDTLVFNAKGEQTMRLEGDKLSIDYFAGTYGIASTPNKDSIADGSRLYALIDKKGNLLTEYKYDTIFPSDYSPPYCYGIIYARRTDGKVGAFNPDGSVLIPFEYEDLQNPYPKGNVIVATRLDKASGKKLYGYYLTNGKKLFDAIYDGAVPFNNAHGVLQKNGKWAIVDVYGNFVTGFDYYGSGGSFGQGLMVVAENSDFADNPEDPKNLYGAVDTKGNLVIPYDHYSVKIGGMIDLARLDGRGSSFVENPVTQAYAVKVYVNDYLLYMDSEPVIKDDRAMVSVRAIAEHLGFDVEWLPEEKTAVIQDTKRILRIKLDEQNASVNIFDDGIPAESVPLDVPAQIINGRTMVPVRFIAENFGANVDWDGEARTVKITTE
ncbi:MAG: WG repeat-containing protein [Clostridiales Family XIII bacterium]|jgi:hypothetical protein|nr:WG repeat-containing protein [Clostridiales Family XIII bacterium]